VNYYADRVDFVDEIFIAVSNTMAIVELSYSLVRFVIIQIGEGYMYVPISYETGCNKLGLFKSSRTDVQSNRIFW